MPLFGVCTKRPPSRKCNWRATDYRAVQTLDDSNPEQRIPDEPVLLQGTTTQITDESQSDGSGDQTGTLKTIEWNFKEELGDFVVKLPMKCVQGVHHVCKNSRIFDVDKSYKTRQELSAQLETRETTIKYIELFQGGERIIGELNHPQQWNLSLGLCSPRQTQR